MFSGAVNETKVSLSGANRGRRGAGVESRAELLKRQHRERDEREQRRARERAAREIQRVYRGWKERSRVGEEHRKLFDKRCSDLARVEGMGMLPPPARATFVFKAILTILPLIAFFFLPSNASDAPRLSRFVEMVLFSAQQVASSNILHQTAAAEDARRMSFVVLFQRVLQGLMRLGQADVVAKLLHQMQLTLFAPGADTAVAKRSAAAVGLWIRRTKLLQWLTAEAMLMRPGAAESTDRAVRCALVCCLGIEEGQASRQADLMAVLLSTPRLLERLSSEPLHELAPILLQRLGAALPLPPSAADSAQVFSALQEEVAGTSRLFWFIGNLSVLVERLLTSRGDIVRLPVWLGWICWAKSQVHLVSRGSAGNTQMSLLNSSSFARAVLRAVDEQDSQKLMPAILEIYFSTPRVAEGSSDDSGEPSTEALHALAFTTTLTERLYPSVADLAHCPSMATAFHRLGASTETFDSVAAIQLRAFCSVYKIQLQAMYDAEFHGPANPLRPEQVGLVAPFLNRLGYSLVTQWPSRKAMAPQGQALRSAIVSLVRAFYQRQVRRPVLQVAEGASTSKWWQIPEARQLLQSAPIVDLGTDAPPPGAAPEGQDADDEDEDDPMQVDDAQGLFSEASASRQAQQQPQGRLPAMLGGSSAAREVLEAVLEELPHVLPFEDRVQLLHNVILVDQDNREYSRAPWARSRLVQHRIRRNFLVEDGFSAFDGLNTDEALREVFKVEFIAPDGTPESGIDGGGLFKEFMIHICRETFDPKYGLFTATDDGTLYPSPSAFRVHANAAELYRFLGKVVGKAVYEMLLLEPQFSRVFLNRILGLTNEVDDVAALDRELHRGMLRLKETDDIEQLGLTFTISATNLGQTEDIDLMPNGSSIPVTKQNLTQYLHLVAHFRTNLQIRRHTQAFVQGLQSVIPLAWLKMFDPYELNTLISGSTSTFNVADLRENTGYGNGYHENSDVIKWLWELLEKHLEPEDMAKFLMFTTSCSRPPLLGFKTLYPRFGIHRVPDPGRLPTASTCANLLKLPEYRSFAELKSKVLEAIRAECGFDLS